MAVLDPATGRSPVIPEHIAQRIAQYPRPALPLLDSPDVRVGDLRNARPAQGGPSRLVLVVALNDSESVQVTLVHPYVDLATSRDLVVPRASLDLPYDLVIETDLAGVIWRTDLGKRVGTVPMAIVDSYFTGHVPADMPQVYFGHTLAGSLDVRWTFKDQEGDELEAMSADCTATLLEGKSWWRPDVGDVLPKFFTHAPNYEIAMMELVEDWMKLGDAMDFRPADWSLIVDLELAERAAWVERLGEEIGGLFWDSVLQLWHFQSTRSNRPAPAEGAEVDVRKYEHLFATAR